MTNENVSQATAPNADAPSPAEPMDAVDVWLLNELQESFPVAVDPWAELGQRRGRSGQDILARVIRAKEQGFIRQIGPIFDTKALGYQSLLIASRVDPQQMDAAAAVISSDPGVSHNYAREADYNLWFTLAVPPGEQIEQHLARLAADAGLQAYLPLPSTRTFRIGVKLNMGADSSAPKRAAAPSPAKPQRPRRTEPFDLTDMDKKIVRLSQVDLPLVPRPFDLLCDALGLNFEQLKAWMDRMESAGVLRRFAAIMRHRQAGFTANGMGIWQVPEAKIEQAGLLASQFPEVSHCYQRPSYPDWPYNLYTMIHARSRDACQEIIGAIAEQLGPLGVPPARILYSTTEYKKQRVRYFV